MLLITRGQILGVVTPRQESSRCGSCSALRKNLRCGTVGDSGGMCSNIPLLSFRSPFPLCLIYIYTSPQPCIPISTLKTTQVRISSYRHPTPIPFPSPPISLPPKLTTFPKYIHDTQSNPPHQAAKKSWPCWTNATRPGTSRKCSAAATRPSGM